MSGELISRESLCEKIRAMQHEAHQNMVDAGYNDDRMGAVLWDLNYKIWEQAYSMVVREPIVKQESIAKKNQGEWTYAYIGDPEVAMCSRCGYKIDRTEISDFDEYKFCPNCGAKMEGDNT